MTVRPARRDPGLGGPPGTEFVDAAVVDGQLVSARACPDHPAWMRGFIQILRSKAPV